MLHSWKVVANLSALRKGLQACFKKCMSVTAVSGKLALKKVAGVPVAPASLLVASATPSSVFNCCSAEGNG